MKGFIQIILLYLLIGAWTDVNAQSNLLCVRGDTIFWEIPPNPCGAFNNYNVYISSNPTGPFSLLSTVTDPNQNFYYHPNPSSTDRYYYFNVLFNCPSIPDLGISDTIDNRIPNVSPIIVATVNANFVNIEWQASTSPEVIGYIIYRSTDIGTIPIDTVYSGTQYTDINADPNAKSENYFVLALDGCNSTSIFDLAHQTIYLETTSNDICEQQVNLNWNAYQNWTNGIERQEVWASTNGGPSSIVATLEATDTSYTFLNTNDGENYCFFIRAIENGTAVVSNSNESCITTNVVQPMRNLILTNASVTGDNDVSLSWNWDTNADIVDVAILTSMDNNNYTSIANEMPSFPLVASENYIDINSLPDQGKIYYKIQTTDECDSLVQSNYASTIYTTGIALDNRMNRVNWTAFDIESASIIEYEVFAIIDGIATSIGVVDPDINFLDHAIDPLNNAAANTCYFVVASATIPLANGNTEMINTRSNTSCVEQFATLFMPNAFSPRGINQVFKPVVSLAESAIFEMHIFDRWGQKLFSTNNIDEGWDGKINGNEPKIGVYTYYVKLVQSNGTVIEKQGSVMLLK